ncbi:hypothetical protein [Nocardiopsis sp. CC223A]|uniref:hypothetical protein n=1 Tax=Nocardiopsis sp. CC223A TaxID=3044051 RepID=UPI00278C37F0|nr:hypothetical protein [Nocardiopsis sp. CC223A]
MSAGAGGARPAPVEGADPARYEAPGQDDPVLTTVVAAVTFPVLVAAGAAAGLLSATGAGWLTRYWEAGTPAQVLGAVGLVALLGALYGLCRLCAWGTRGVSGGVAFALGFMAVAMVLTMYMPGGDIVLTDHLLHYGYLFGSMVVLAIAVVRGVREGGNPFPAGPPPAPKSDRS